MKRTRRITSLFLALALSLGCIGTAFADETNTVSSPGGSAEAAVMLTVTEDPMTNVFSATIPAVIPVAVDTKGDVFTPSNVQIINNNVYRGIKASDIHVTPSNGWVLADYNTGIFTTQNGRNFSVSLRGDTADPSTGDFVLTQDNWNVGAGATLPIPMGMKVDPQSSVGNTSSIATISFTLDWSDNGTSEDPVIPPEKDYYEITFDAGENGSFKDQSTSLEISKAELAEKGTIRVSFPTVYPNSGYAFNHWVIVGADGSETDVGETIYLSGDITIKAVCAPRDHDVYITWYGGEHGSVVDNSGKAQSSWTQGIDAVGGSFNYSAPAVTPDDGWVVDKWVNTVDGSDIANGNLKPISGNNFSVMAIYKSSAISVTYRVANAWASTVKLIDPDSKEDVSTITQVIYPDSDGRFTVSFPNFSTDENLILDKWVNTNSGSDTETSGIEFDGNSRTVDLTLCMKAAPTIYAHPHALAGGTLDNENEILIPYQQTVSMPSCIPNPGYKFDTWCYANGDPIGFDEEKQMYSLNNSYGVESADGTRLDIDIYARFIPA